MGGEHRCAGRDSEHPPSWRSVLKVPDAWPIAAGGMEDITELCVAGMAMEIPSPAMASGATRSG